MQNDFIHILLADDDEDDRMFFKDAFEEIKLKTKVSTVKDGIELIKYLSRPNIILPHLLFLDLNMPLKNGMECLKEIKSIDKFKEIAIAIYSTSASEEDIEHTFVNGANVYIKKPSNFETLKKILSEVITINWQYQTSGLNRDNFLLSL
ncbi:MAG: response regulator [Bacteroidia bacterium]|jgi:CheY-like chemotaxis protein|nr:response regulator [Bacteroidia bacterium]MBP7245482.1 response regulator [Bacteroidia bacterium]